MALEDNEYILQMKHIDMFFPGVKALKDVSFNLKKGEIISLMGENGAGKSTLVKVLTGVYHKTNGEITFDGKVIEPTTPLASQQMGISTVYQEVNLCANLSVAENIYIGREPRGAFGRIDWATMQKNASDLLFRELGIDIDVTKELNFYPVAMQQMIAIARAIDTQCKVLILDEPTSSLSDKETERLFKIMRNLKSQGISIIFISHFLEQIYTICDRITVLRDGTYIGEYDIKSLPRIELISKMMGKEVKEGEIEMMDIEHIEFESVSVKSQGEIQLRQEFIKRPIGHSDIPPHVKKQSSIPYVGIELYVRPSGVQAAPDIRCLQFGFYTVRESHGFLRIIHPFVHGLLIADFRHLLRVRTCEKYKR